MVACQQGRQRRSLAALMETARSLPMHRFRRTRTVIGMTEEERTKSRSCWLIPTTILMLLQMEKMKKGRPYCLRHQLRRRTAIGTSSRKKTAPLMPEALVVPRRRPLADRKRES